MASDDHKTHTLLSYSIINLCFYFMCGVKRDRVRKKNIDEFVYMSYLSLHIHNIDLLLVRPTYYVRYEIYKDQT